MNGALVVNKPRGLTSHDVVQRVRRIVGTRSVGHLGTLDPLATGVLPLLLGCATRLQRFYIARRKRYEGKIRFGFATDTYDADGHALGDDLAPEVTLAELEPHVAKLRGTIRQVPPPYSAKKVKGVAAYELARRREKFKLEPVEVRVHHFVLSNAQGATVDFEVECSSGTYIRSLAHDLGKMTGLGAHLAEIRRIASGEFTLDQAVTLEDLENAARGGGLPQVLVPLGELLPELPSATLTPLQEGKVRHGGRIELNDAQIEPGSDRRTLDGVTDGQTRLRLLGQDNELIAIAEAVVPRVYRPVVVLAPQGAAKA